MKYLNIKFKEVEVSGRDAEPERVCELAHQMIKNGEYAFIISEGNKILLKVDAFNDCSSGKYTDYPSEWAKYCSTHRVWAEWNQKWDDGTGNPTSECMANYGLIVNEDTSEWDTEYEEYNDEEWR